ncbi:MAG: Ig-like domain-containing protein [Candidatus Izimaplasma sp.]|nr:Ig-like domain-containing protein [Candidatus Izimaplasma bacterium]
MKKLVLFLSAFILAITLVGCGNSPDEPTTYTVTFDTDGGTEIAAQEVKNGYKVTKPQDPEKDGYVFSGKWMEGKSEWDFDVDIVTEDITLTADWLVVSSTPSNIKMTDDLFTSTVTWQQTDADLQTFDVLVKAEDAATYTELTGDINVDTGDVLDTVTFTPNTLPEGGYYTVKVVAGTEEVISNPVLFGGAGTEPNPYQLSKVSDILALLDTEALADKHFVQATDILMTIEALIDINDARKVVFSGVYDGANYRLSFGGNGGLFHEITTEGIVKNIIIDEATQLSASEDNFYPIGVIADTNNGLIENITTRAKVFNARLQGEIPAYDGTIDTNDLTTGAGAIVGINGATGTIRNVDVSGAGLVKAGRAVGGVSAYNFGLIEKAIVTATLPAGNQANSGKSSNRYSFGGGITGFNFGTITECAVGGRVFAQSAYSTEGDGNEGKNIAFGGIAGYNEGTITQSSFAREFYRKEFIDKTRSAELQDKANNLGVASIHGDLYVGGIAGINAGTITNAYVGGALIGGRDFVGGITGLTLGNGNISNSYVFAEIAIKDEGGVKITEPNAKTTVTTYDIAPDGFDAATTLYKPLINSETQNVWIPGDLAEPTLPVFDTTDLAVVGNAFADNGLLIWQSGVVTDVDIVMDNKVINHGETTDVEYTISPTNAPDTFTTWTSSDESVVEIVGTGTIKGVGAGTATITVTTRDGGFTDTVEVTVEDYTKIDEVTVTTAEMTLPEPNNSDDRPMVSLGTMLTFSVDILPEDADYQNFTLSSSNSRAQVDGNVVTFVYGNTGPGRVSITVNFEDTSVAPLEFRFETFETEADIPIENVVVTADEMAMPTANDSEDRPLVAIGDTLTLTVDILPTNASNQNYTITTSNSRAEVNGNVITFVYGNTGPGRVSVYVNFEDPAIGQLNFRFETFEEVSITDVIITADNVVMPEPNNSDDRPTVDIGTTITIDVVIMPADATNQNYTITTSNSRAEADGHTVTFVYGNTGPGRVSVYITFEDPAIGELNYRFRTQESTE